MAETTRRLSIAVERVRVAVPLRRGREEDSRTRSRDWTALMARDAVFYLSCIVAALTVVACGVDGWWRLLSE